MTELQKYYEAKKTAKAAKKEAERIRLEMVKIREELKRL